MKSQLPSLSHRREIILAILVLTCTPFVSPAANRQKPRVNEYGAPVLDSNGRRINYDRQTLEAMARTAAPKKESGAVVSGASTTARSEFVPAVPTDQQPFWQYAIFGSGIGSSNFIIGPTPAGGGAREIIFGNSSPFWQSIRHNSRTGNYDQVFVSPLYQPRNGDPFVIMSRIGLAHVTSPSDWQIVVMLEDGRIYLYDFATKAQVGYFDAGPYPFYSGLRGLSLTDLNGDGLVEIIVTTQADLFVYSGSGQLLWQATGAGGYDVVVGQMDNDAALEIAASSGKVVDATTHTIQWTRNGGFGSHLKLAPFPGENYQQLIAAVNGVSSFDVGRQLPRWSIPVDISVDALDVADVDNDGMPEVIYGDDQWGALHVHDLVTQAEKWFVNNPEHGVTNIAVADVDADGVVDLLWGAGYSSSGSDYLYVANTGGSHDIKWQSVDLQGPFLGPAIGDLDGDGQPELVICSVYSEATYDSGRILVFDLANLTLRAISAPVVDNGAWEGVRDFKLRDIDGDGRMEIIIAADSYYDGAVEIYRFNSDKTFTRTWTNATQPFGSPFNRVDVADLDGNGSPKIIAANSIAHSGSTGVYVYIYDYPSGAQSWQSVNLSGGSDGVTGLIVQDLDANGTKEIAALVGYTSGLYTWDGSTRQLRNLQQATGFKMLGNRVSPPRLIGGDSTGVGHFLQYGRNRYTERLTQQLAGGNLNGVNGSAGGALWTGSGNVLNLRLAPSYETVVWQSPAVGGSFGRFVATDFRNGQNRVFSSAQHAVVGFTYTVPAPTVVSAVSRKNHGAAGPFDIPLPVSGTPGIECRTGGPTNDYQVVVTFANAVAVNSTPQAQVTSGSATVGNSGVSNGGIVTTNGNSVTVPLTNVADAQTLQITLFGVSDGLGSGDVVVPISILTGDASGNGAVNATDVSQTKGQIGQTVSQANFRSDVNLSGSISASDVSIVKANAGHGLP